MFKNKLVEAMEEMNVGNDLYIKGNDMDYEFSISKVVVCGELETFVFGIIGGFMDAIPLQLISIGEIADRFIEYIEDGLEAGEAIQTKEITISAKY